MNFNQLHGQRAHRFSNWLRINECQPELYFEPNNVDQLKEILAAARANHKHVRAVGSGHSMAGFQCSDNAAGQACTEDYMVSMKHFDRILQVWPEKRQVKVESGVLIKDFNVALERQNLAFAALPALDSATVGGIISTDVHGSGQDVHIMSHYIVELELLLTSGETVILSREKDEESFLAAALSCGSMGIILSVVLQCTTAFNLLVTHDQEPLRQVLDNIHQSVAASDYFCVFWHPSIDTCVVKRQYKTSLPVNHKPNWFWNKFVAEQVFEFALFVASYFQLLNSYVLKAFLWLFVGKGTSEVNTSYKVFRTNVVTCLTMEYAVPSQMIVEVLTKMKEWMERNNFVTNTPILIRYVRVDDFYLSPAYGRDVFYICNDTFWPCHRIVNHERLWKACEEICLKAGGRPHWGKCFGVTWQHFKSMYPMWNKFHEIRKKFDPNGMFMNEFLENAFGRNN